MYMKELSVSDVTELQKICVDTFYDAFATYNTAENMSLYLDRQYNLEKLISELKNKNTYFYFIFDDDHGAVGYLKLNTADAQSENTFKDALEIERIYIRHAFQNQGLGEILYNIAKTKATLLGKKQVWLGVWEYNQTAITFYQQYGFEFAGSRTVHLGDAPQIDLLMVKHL